MDVSHLIYAQRTLNFEAIMADVQWTYAAIATLVVLAAYFGIQYVTQMGVIARATAKEALRQPIFLLLALFGVFILGLLTILPFFALGADLKMMKDCGLMHILVSCLLLAIWTASTSIASEIEGKTAMTLLSKPITRRQFIVGKFMGICNSVMALWVVLSFVFLLCVYFKTVYDGREAGEIPDMSERMALTFQIVPGLVLILLEAFVLTSISVAISTRLPMFVNIVACFIIFVLGQLTPVLVEQSAFKIEFVQFIAQWLATILPSLESYNVQTAITTNSIVSAKYIGTIACYSLCYCLIAMLFSFILFEDRDLA